MRVDETRDGWSTWEWLFGLLVILSFTYCLPLARRLPMIVRTVAQWVLFLAPVLLIAISWDRFGVARSDQSEHRSRIWVSFVGCNALAAALVVPVVTVFFGVFLRLDWSKVMECSLGLSIVALVSSLFGARSLRFPLFCGGLAMAALLLIIPVGIL